MTATRVDRSIIVYTAYMIWAPMSHVLGHTRPRVSQTWYLLDRYMQTPQNSMMPAHVGHGLGNILSSSSRPTPTFQGQGGESAASGHVIAQP